MITNLEESYALFIYECNSIEWTGRFTFPTIGFNSPSTATFMNHPLTGQSDANEIACRDRNVLYQISVSQSFVETQKRMCVEWYSSDIERFNENVTLLNFVTPSCPCSLFQTFFDRRYSLLSFRNNLICYSLRFPSFRFPFVRGTDRECCYTLESAMFGALITDPAVGGSLLLFENRAFVSYEENNFRPKSYCCSDVVGLCSLYTERRPSDNCARYRPPRRCK